MKNSAVPALAAILIMCFAMQPAIASGKSKHSNSEIQWSPHAYALRSGEPVAAEIGKLEVPLMRSRSDSGVITLQFVRLPKYPGASGSPIIYLAGGPGGSGIEAGRGERYRLFDRLRRSGDVILLDQRGTGHSSPPPPCSKQWSFPADSVATEVAINTSLEESLRSCSAEWRTNGIVLEAYNTADNADDVADLIQALGVSKANLVGISYGTFLGFAALRRHGKLINRAVFAGTEGPDHTIKLPTQADTALTRLSREIESASSDKNSASNLEDSVKRVFAQLSKAPIVVEGAKSGPVTVSLYDLQAVTAFLMATSENAGRLPGMFKALEAGDFMPAAQMTLRLRKFLGELPAMAVSMDAASPTSEKRKVAVARLAGRSIFANAVNFPSADLAKGIGVPQLPQSFTAPIRSNVPALFISGTLDSRTPPENAEEVRKGFRESAHLVLDGAGHDNDLFLSSPIILDRIGEFLAGQPVADQRIEVSLFKPD